MKISYLITCCNETTTLNNLLKRVGNSVMPEDDIVILADTNHGEETHNILGVFHHWCGSRLLTHSLNNDYGAHKNYGIEHCSGDYIFQLDGDELPPESLLGENLHALVESNPNVEAYAVPRINDFKGVTPQHAAQWGWRLTESPTYKTPIVNWPDWQFRIFKRDYPRISFLRKLHEKIEGYKEYSFLPADEDWAIYHDKTIEKQIETNLRYNKQFSVKDNKGHTVS